MKPQRTMSPFTYQAVTEKTQHSHLFLGSSFFIEKKKKTINLCLEPQTVDDELNTIQLVR